MSYGGGKESIECEEMNREKRTKELRRRKRRKKDRVLGLEDPVT